MTRLLLDAHLSGRAIGRALQDRGHVVRALDAEKNLEGLRDEDVLQLAISEDRVLITANVADFLPFIGDLVSSGRSHPGCILIPNSFRNEDFGPPHLCYRPRASGGRARGMDRSRQLGQETLSPREGRLFTLHTTNT